MVELEERQGVAITAVKLNVAHLPMLLTQIFSKNNPKNIFQIQLKSLGALNRPTAMYR